ncbi:MAG: DUF559 domain-containing protein, partial [Acidimicrobiia bacterium]
LIVEADGSQHGGQYDQERDSFLRSVGFTVIRFWSWDVIRDLDAVVSTVAEEIDRLRVVPPTVGAMRLRRASPPPTDRLRRPTPPQGGSGSFRRLTPPRGGSS